MDSLLPDVPKEFNGAGVLTRLIDTILVRYTIASSDLRVEDKHFQVTPESMSMLVLQKHILQLILWSAHAIGVELPKLAIPESFDERKAEIEKMCRLLRSHVAEMDDEALSKVTIYLKRADTHYPIWYLINGPLSDAIHHIGQMISWRRISGNPAPQISPFTGLTY